MTACEVVSGTLQAIDKLSGQWKLLYTVNSELTGLLGLGRLPGIEVGEISQSVNALTLSITNSVTIGGPISRTAFSAKAAFEIMSPKRIQVGDFPTLCAALPGNKEEESKQEAHVHRDAVCPMAAHGFLRLVQFVHCMPQSWVTQWLRPSLYTFQPLSLQDCFYAFDCQCSVTYDYLVFTCCQVLANHSLHFSLPGQVRFERAVIETPQILTDKEFPSYITLLGQSVDLTSLKVTLPTETHLLLLATVVVL